MELKITRLYLSALLLLFFAPFFIVMLDTNKFRSENNSPVLITQRHDKETLFILTWKQDRKSFALSHHKNRLKIINFMQTSVKSMYAKWKKKSETRRNEKWLRNRMRKGRGKNAIMMRVTFALKFCCSVWFCSLDWTVDLLPNVFRL